MPFQSIRSGRNRQPGMVRRAPSGKTITNIKRQSWANMCFMRILFRSKIRAVSNSEALPEIQRILELQRSDAGGNSVISGGSALLKDIEKQSGVFPFRPVVAVRNHEWPQRGRGPRSSCARATGFIIDLHLQSFLRSRQGMEPAWKLRLPSREAAVAAAKNFKQIYSVQLDSRFTAFPWMLSARTTLCHGVA